MKQRKHFQKDARYLDFICISMAKCIMQCLDYSPGLRQALPGVPAAPDAPAAQRPAVLPASPSALTTLSWQAPVVELKSMGKALVL